MGETCVKIGNKEGKKVKLTRGKEEKYKEEERENVYLKIHLSKIPNNSNTADWAFWRAKWGEKRVKGSWFMNFCA